MDILDLPSDKLDEAFGEIFHVNINRLPASGEGGYASVSRYWWFDDIHHFQRRFLSRWWRSNQRAWRIDFRQGWKPELFFCAGIDASVTEFEWARRIIPTEDRWLTVEAMRVLLAHNKVAAVFLTDLCISASQLPNDECGMEF